MPPKRGGSQQTKSRCDNVVTTLCFGCGNVVNATLWQRKNVDSKSRCGHVAITTLHSQPACIFMHTHIHTYTHIYTEFDSSRPWSRDNCFFLVSLCIPFINLLSNYFLFHWNLLKFQCLCRRVHLQPEHITVPKCRLDHIRLVTCLVYKSISQCSGALYYWQLSKKVSRFISFKHINIPFIIPGFYKYDLY